MRDQQKQPAGDFAAWLCRTRDVLARDATADVPCGACTACCTSFYFVHVGPGETEALARIPRELLFAAPGLPEGTMVLGYDEHGRCPMLVDEKCSIYEARPLTCRIYDCRVFAAAGIAADRPAITQRARHWVFDYPVGDDRRQHAAVRVAARFIQKHAECFPGGAVPRDPAQLAVLAVKVGDVFLDYANEPDLTGSTAFQADIARAIVEANEKFAAGRARLVDGT